MCVIADTLLVLERKRELVCVCVCVCVYVCVIGEINIFLFLFWLQFSSVVCLLVTHNLSPSPSDLPPIKKTYNTINNTCTHTHTLHYTTTTHNALYIQHYSNISMLEHQLLQLTSTSLHSLQISICYYYI